MSPKSEHSVPKRSVQSAEGLPGSSIVDAGRDFEAPRSNQMRTFRIMNTKWRDFFYLIVHELNNDASSDIGKSARLESLGIRVQLSEQ